MYYLGLDIGGSKIRIALYCDFKKEIISFKSNNFLSCNQVKDEVLENIYDPVLRLLLAKQLTIDDVAGIGLSFAGNIELATGRVIRWPNRLTWQGFALLPFLENLFKRKIMTEDDGNCAALGEHIHLRNCDFYKGSLIYFGIGTGIGGGIILNHKLYRGDFGAAADIGHFVINNNDRKCKCGKVGCLQTYREDITTNRKFQKTLTELIYNLSYYLDIGCVVLGGGGIEFYPEFSDNIINEFNRLKVLDHRNIIIKKSDLYNRNGIWGALSMVCRL